MNHIAVWVAADRAVAARRRLVRHAGNAWLAAIGKTEAQAKADIGTSPLPYVTAFVAALAIAYTLAWLLPRLGARSAVAGARVGALLALTLIGATLATNYGFEARSLSLWLINTGYMFVGMAIMGAIVGGWRRRRDARAIAPPR